MLPETARLCAVLCSLTYIMFKAVLGQKVYFYILLT